MFVWVLLILNDFQLDCKLIGTFSDHHAGPSRMQKPRRRPQFVFYLFKKKKRRRPFGGSKFPTPLENARMCCTHSLHMADMQWFFFLSLQLYIYLNTRVSRAELFAFELRVALILTWPEEVESFRSQGKYSNVFHYRLWRRQRMALVLRLEWTPIS